MKDSIIPHIKDALQQPIPDPKYKLWQHTPEGQIVGFYWLSIDSAWLTKSIPGWWYMISESAGEQAIHESEIKIKEGE